jgi:hypothetical protein
MLRVGYNTRMKNASPKLSAASKMPCKSWSLPAWKTCPGARNADGSPVDACSLCYALQGRYTFGAVEAVREHNLSDWQADDWVDAMVQHIGKSKFFRWFDSGDIYNVTLAYKILDVVMNTPGCAHWIPTRAYKDDTILPVLRMMQSLPNCVVRFSSDSVDGEVLENEEHSSTIISDDSQFISGKGNVLCTAYKRKGKCGNCRACFNKRVRVVTYPKHARKVNPKMFEKSLAK